MIIGFHLPFSGSLRALMRKLGTSRGNAFQSFARSLRGGKLQSLKPDQLKAYYNYLDENQIRAVVIHAPYSYNLASDDPDLDAMILEDLAFAETLRASYYVLHPGYYKDLHPFEAIQRVKIRLMEIAEQTPFSGKILIKNMAGAGSEIGAKWEEFRELTHFHPKVKGALDAARLFASGIDIRKTRIAQDIERHIGWKNIHVLYVNDTLKGCGARKNQYVPLGEGAIGWGGYEALLSSKEAQNVCWIVENQPTILHYDRSLDFLMKFSNQV